MDYYLPHRPNRVKGTVSTVVLLIEGSSQTTQHHPPHPHIIHQHILSTKAQQEKSHHRLARTHIHTQTLTYYIITIITIIMSTLLFVQQKIVGRQSVGGDGRMLRRLGRVVTARSSNNNNIRMTTRATSATSSSSSSSSWRGQQQQRPLPLQTYHYRWYHASSTVHASASAAAGEPTPEELAAEQDPTSIPEWQNPKHAATAATTAEPQFFDDDNNEDATPSIMNNNAAPLPPFETSPDAVVAPPHIEALAHQIVQLNLLELKELTDQIAQAFDFDDDMMAASYGAGAAMAAPGAAAAADAEPEEVKTIFDIKLIGTYYPLCVLFHVILLYYQQEQSVSWMLGWIRGFLCMEKHRMRLSHLPFYYSYFLISCLFSFVVGWLVVAIIY